ncbi:uncharacterized protein LOC110655851 [Hevea brasiliensis]|nr:uncharacterized protein LOC110655851 [Hevea brasiliensis]
MEMAEEAALGTAFGLLIQAILTAKEKAIFFRKTLQNLQDTIEKVDPIIREVLKLENAPTDACSRFVQLLEKAKILVEMYSDMKKWKLLKKRKVKKLIQEIDASVQRLMMRDLQAEQLLYLAQMNEKMDHVIALFGNSDATNGEEFHNKIAANGSSSKPETGTENEGNKPSSPTFEMRWKMRKGKCLEIRLW